MRRNSLFLIVFAIVLAGHVGTCRATVIFSDDFNNNVLDASKWSALTDAGCSLAVSGGALHNYFSGAAAPRGSYAKSVNVELPSNWSSVTITGQWAFPVQVYGEMVMSVKNADAPQNWDSVSYYVWNGPGFRANDPIQGSSSTSRVIPTSLTNFEWTITQTGWQFKEYRSGTWTTLVDRTTTSLAGMSRMYLQIGGWEYSYTSQQRTDYDNIVISVIPEPATILLLACGVLVLKKRK